MTPRVSLAVLVVICLVGCARGGNDPVVDDAGDRDSGTDLGVGPGQPDAALPDAPVEEAAVPDVPQDAPVSQDAPIVPPDAPVARDTAADILVDFAADRPRPVDAGLPDTSPAGPPDGAVDGTPDTPPPAPFCRRVQCDCTFEGKKLYGRVKFVDGISDQPDFKVKVVTLQAEADLKVKRVNFSPIACGEWQEEMFPPLELKVQVVNTFEDFSIIYVNDFPGTF